MLLELYKALEKPTTSKYGNTVQMIILINLVINIIVAATLLFFDTSPYNTELLKDIESVTVAVFCAELVLRYCVIGVNQKYQGFRGKVKFTVTPFIIIDILSLIPYLLTGISTDGLFLRSMRFLKALRLLRFLRLKDSMKQMCSIGAFATSTVSTQFVILLFCSVCFISLFDFIFEGGQSISLFFAPQALASVERNHELFWAILEVVFGLIIGGTLISIISGLLNKVSNSVRSGYYPYKGKNHIVIINRNLKLNFIIEEINSYYKNIGESQDVVLFTPYDSSFEELVRSIGKYSNIRVHFMRGNPFVWETYNKLNINAAEKILILKNSPLGTDSNINYSDEKIVGYLCTHTEFNNTSADFIVESDNSISNIVYSQLFTEVPNNVVIVDNHAVLHSFLNRSITHPNYFNIYSHFLSFKNSQIKFLKFSDYYEDERSFKEIYKTWDLGVVIGVLQNNKVIINPEKNFCVGDDDELIVITRAELFHIVNKSCKKNDTQVYKNINVPQPTLKSSRNICFIGSYQEMEIESLYEFLDEESIGKIEKFDSTNNEGFFDENFWNPIIDKSFDMVILNLEDQFEFILTTYLRHTFKEHHSFLNSLVNIIHNDSLNSQILNSHSFKNSVIYSEEILGEYITQALFINNVVSIFDELTHSKGSELYLLKREMYEYLYEMEINQIKHVLLENNILYIGILVDGKLLIDAGHMSDKAELVVIAKGV